MIMRRYPLILARVATHHARANLAAARAAYSGARRELAGEVPPEAIEATLEALAKEGAVLASTATAMELVCEALAGRRWRPKL